MNKRKKRNRILIILLFLIYSIVLVKVSSSPTSIISSKTNDPYLARFIENYNVLKENWYFFKSEKEVIGAATNAMTSSNIKNDRYTQYIPASESKEYFESMESNYVGLGIKYLMSREYPIVSEVFNNSPAMDANLQVGDLILKVNNKSLKGLKTDDIRKIVVGKVGDSRVLEVQRGSKKYTLQAKLKAVDSSVNYKIIDGKGYLEFNEFSKTSPQSVKKALDYYKEKKIKSVIIDLRSNPGGFLDALQEISDYFMKKDQVILAARDKKGNIEYYKTTNNDVYDLDVALLVGKNTASAAEVLSVALMENVGVKSYGETTFGKGIMQGYFQYKDSAYLKYTNAEWLTPKGNAINQKGIKPSVEIKMSQIFEAANLSFDFKKDIKFDSVNPSLVSYQKALKALGYSVDRVDGYYSQKTQDAISKFKKDYKINEVDLGGKTQTMIVKEVIIQKAQQKNDNVLNEVLKKYS